MNKVVKSNRSKEDKKSDVPGYQLLQKTVDFLLKYNTFLILIILIVVSSFLSEAFFTSRNITNLLRQISGIGIVSLGMLLVIITGGIDLSVGSIVAFSGVLSAYFLLTMPFSIGIGLTIFTGIMIGSVSGYLVAIRRMAPFIATLALMTIVRGLGFILSKGTPIILEDSGQILKEFGSNYFLGIPNPVVLMFIVFILVYFLLKYTVFGRLIIAIGSNEESVRLSGINVWIYKFSVYSLCGGFAAIAGIISTSRTGVGSPILGIGLELDAIAAVVIGGASLKGGKGSAVNTLLGIIILGMIGNIMNLMNVPGYPQQVIKGLIIIFAVLLQGIKRKENS
jgi:ribose transport system permease protein